MRGENFHAQLIASPRVGTSPRARGKLELGDEEAGSLRNIPACAGKTCPGTLAQTSGPEHPRVRGENSMMKTMKILHQGTSPRARGKHVETITLIDPMRNIPACAGKTSICLSVYM